MRSLRKFTRILLAVVLTTLVIASLALTLAHTHDGNQQHACAACAILRRMHGMIGLPVSSGAMLSVLLSPPDKNRIARAVKGTVCSLVSLKVRLNP
ncbi:MAG: hypothetical protein FWF69_04205 [Firmicutes bacterium]|nr:hypothetical protein [Bacillota bacterium]